MGSFADIFEQWEMMQGKTLDSEKKDRKKRIISTDINKIMMARLDRDGVPDKDAYIEIEPRRGYTNPKKLPINKKIDLHMETKEKALEKLTLFFQKAVKFGWKKVLIIHGKGRHLIDGAVLGKVVWEFLEKCPNAGQHGYEDNRGGGKGATWVMIKNEDR